MTYGDLLQLLPTLLNRTAADLSSRVDLVRRAVKWSYAHLLTRADLDCFYTFADVEVTSPTGLTWRSFTDVNDNSVRLSSIKGVNLLNTEGTRYNAIELIMRQHKRFRDIIRQPLSVIEYNINATPCGSPVAYTLNERLHLYWFDEPQVPSVSTIRLEGNIAFPNFLDSSGLNDGQETAVDWVLENGENYLIAKSMEFLMMYAKEDDRFLQYATVAEREFQALTSLNVLVQGTGTSGYSLD